MYGTGVVVLALENEGSNRTFVLLCACLNLTLLLVIDTALSRNLTCMGYFAIQTHYCNGDDDGALCVGLCSLNVCNGVILTLALDEQEVCLDCYMCI